MSAGKDMRVKSLLTNREREVFELLVQDKTTKEIAAQLFVSEKTVRNHISNVICSLVHGCSRTVTRTRGFSSLRSFAPCPKHVNMTIRMDEDSVQDGLHSHAPGNFVVEMHV